MKIFWSWQADRHRKTGQYFVRDALIAAAEQLDQELDLTQAERLEIDHDTKGVPGTPPIVDTILAKIEEATIFIGDVTPIGESESGKLIPNPNVMIELGYARKVLGFEAVILVANSEYLPGPEQLPFDLRASRGPASYRLDAKADKAVRGRQHKAFVNELKRRIADVLTFTLRKEGGQCADPPTWDGRTKWFEDGQALICVGTDGDPQKKVRLPEGPHAFMRIQPGTWPENMRTSQLSPDRGRDFLPERIHSGNGDWGQADGGQLSWCIRSDEHEVTDAESLVQWFASSGEIWSVWTGLMTEQTPQWFHVRRVMRAWGRFLDRAIQELMALGATAPFFVTAGVVGIRGARMDMPITTGEFFAASETVVKSQCLSHETVAQLGYLAQLFNSLTDVFGYPHEITEDKVREIVWH